VKTLSSVEEVPDDRPSAEQNAQLRIERGETLNLLLDEALMLTADGVPIMLPEAGDAIEFTV
jgi:hypothetical protein